MFRLLFNLIVLVLILLGGGLLWFIFITPSSQTNAKVDVVVVLTGGPGRIAKGVEILNADKARKLYISGLNENTNPSTMAANNGLTPDQLACCVITDTATDTKDNAKKTAAWIEASNIRTVRLVTASYHMRRALLEFRSLLPETVILPEPVALSTVETKNWWKQEQSWQKIGEEYLKYILVQFNNVRATLGV